MKKNLLQICKQSLALARIMIVLLFTFISLENGFSQERTINGRVTDLNGVSLPGVNVTVKGTQTGAVTDLNGKYTLKIPGNDAILVFTYVGYGSQEINAGQQTSIDVILNEETTQLNEVVVVGYGTQKKATLTGSVANVKGTDLKKAPSINFSNALAGRVPGLVAYNRSGEPGNDGATIRIRGVNSMGENNPLIVVDGIAGRSLERLDPNDIESISVLKDASAAIYGAQAANGVILITTRRGSLGKPTISFTVNQGYSTPTITPPMADAATYATMLNEINAYRKSKPVYTEEEIQKFRDGSDPWNYPNTDWFKAVFKDYTPQNYYSGSVNGGSENLSYFLSLGAKTQPGIYKNTATKYDQYNFRSNIDGSITKDIKIGFDVSGRNEIKNYPARSSGEIFRMLMRGKPNMHAFWPNGKIGPDIEYGNNPAIITTNETGFDKDKWYVFEGKVKLDINIPWVKGLSFSFNGAMDKSLRNHKRFSKPWYLYTWDKKSYEADGVTPLLVKGKRGFDSPELYQEMEDNQSATLNALTNYKITLADVHNISFMLGAERNEGYHQYFNAYRKHYDSDMISELFAGGDLDKNNDGGSSENARLNYMGRFNYNYSEKYLVEFVFRYDGSYNFPASKRFGFFPGVSLGWRISEESFWKNNLSFINHFKIRGSYGRTGNDRIRAYQYMSNYEYSYVSGSGENKILSGYRFITMNESNELKVLQEGVLGNPNITWETADQGNIGFDAQFFDGKIALEADFFDYRRSNILVARTASTPNTAGIASLPDENIGKTKNQGFDFNLSYTGKRGDFRYEFSLNGGFQKNKIIFWDEQTGPLVPDYQRSTGYPIDSRYNLYYESLGVFKDSAAVNAYPHWDGARPGDVIFKDVNGDSVINGLDRVRLNKNSIPTFTGGFNISLSYKFIDFSMLFQGAAGAQMYINTESGEIGNFLQEYADNRWTTANPNGTNPRTSNRSNEYWKSNGNTFFLQSTDYIRLKNMEIGFTTPPSLNRRLGITSLRLYLSGMNLFTFDKLKSFDPETGGGYPLMKVYNMGVTLTF